MLKSCAVINDLSGFGKCSLGVALPILSVMGIEAHALPTAVLSSQTAFDSYDCISLTDKMASFFSEWKKLNVSFEGILSGFVTDEEQLNIISTFIDEFKTQNNIALIDPVMADNGHLYDGYTSSMCKKIKELCFKADVITPNVAELSYLADKPYSEKLDDIKVYANSLINQGIKNIVVTGYKFDDKIANIVFTDNVTEMCISECVGGYFSGCGDILSSIILGGLVNGKGLVDSTALATEFIHKAICKTNEKDGNYGINFERILGELYEK